MYTHSCTLLLLLFLECPLFICMGTPCHPLRCSLNITSCFWKTFLIISGWIRCPLSSHVSPLTQLYRSIYYNCCNYNYTSQHAFRTQTLPIYLSALCYHPAPRTVLGTQQVSVKIYWAHSVSLLPLKIALPSLTQALVYICFVSLHYSNTIWQRNPVYQIHHIWNTLVYKCHTHSHHACSKVLRVYWQTYFADILSHGMKAGRGEGKEEK